jgi:hypothetical protein
MEFISLSHCYMTLVLRENKNVSSKFDKEGYNYIIDRRTCFLDPELMLNNHDELEAILKSFQSEDPRLINLLLYCHTVEVENETKTKYINSPIYIACGGLHETGNYKSTDLVLNYMA